MTADLRERVARAMYEELHKHVRNCWAWDDSGLDDEHPGIRERFLRQADAAIAALPPAPARSDATRLVFDQEWLGVYTAAALLAEQRGDEHVEVQREHLLWLLNRAALPPAQGWRMVPVEPTEAMMIAYGRGIRLFIDAMPKEVRAKYFEDRTKSYGYRLTEKEKAAARWRAMIQAAPLPAPPVVSADSKGSGE